MQNKDFFSAYHPFVNFIFFALVLIFTMFFRHPVSLCISLAAGILYASYLKGDKGLKKSLKCIIPLMLIAVIINPLFNHRGVTVLAYFPWGNPLTFESIASGAGVSLMLGASLIWFICCAEIMTSDKFVCLFGKVSPSLSLILSMSLRFIPKFKDQFKEVIQSQSLMGKSADKGNFFVRAKNMAGAFSIVLTWALENAVETADSMKVRGYGLPNRSSFAIYTFEKRDRIFVFWICFCGAVLVLGVIKGFFIWNYFPKISKLDFSLGSGLVQIIYFLLCMTPLFLDRREDRKWNYLKSKI